MLTAPELLDRLVSEVPLDAEPTAGGSAAEPFDLPDPRPGPLDSALGADLRRRVGRALDALPPAAAALVRLRYGFAASGRCWPRAAIAGLLGVDEPRLARLEASALADLRGLLRARPRGTAGGAPRASAPKTAHRSRRRPVSSVCAL
ncbi:MAG: hypothetical protein ABFD84_10490 [Candidatus Polarisedimenticolia bacterium]